MTDNSAEKSAENAGAIDPIAEKILELLAAAPPNGSISPIDVAQAVAESRRRPKDPPDIWRRYLPAVKQQALHLARAGKLVVCAKENRPTRKQRKALSATSGLFEPRHTRPHAEPVEA